MLINITFFSYSHEYSFINAACPSTHIEIHMDYMPPTFPYIHFLSLAFIAVEATILFLIFLHAFNFILAGEKKLWFCFRPFTLL